MNVKTLALAGVAGSVAFTSAATAAFTGASFMDVTALTGAPSGTVYRVFANFDTPTNQLLAISGNVNVADLVFSTNTTAQNAAGAFSGLKQEDFAASPLMPAYDSYFSIGTTVFAGNDTNYSPGFLNNDGATAVFAGANLTGFTEDNEGWFDGNPSTAVTGTSIVIMQIWIADTAGGDAGDFNLSGTVDWQPGQGMLMSEAFSVRSSPVPAPGALALLGLAGLAGTRRRRG